MRVIYEGAVFEIMRTGGVARYFEDIISRLPEPIEPILLTPDHVDLSIANSRLIYEPVRTQAPLKLIRKYWRKAQHSVIDKKARKCNGDLVHWTYYTGLCRRPIQRGSTPNVITVYDFIHEAFPELDPSGENQRWQKQAIEAADHICCISETTYEELCERYPSAASRASVTLLGNTFASITAEPIDSQLASRPYALFVGRRGGYKNFETLWNAWNQARKHGSDIALAVVGPPMKSRERSQLGMTHDPEDFFVFDSVSDSLLKGLYQASSAFVFPSKMEGFGLPALEAMESGAPVLASNCGALAEVLQSAGHFFDADDVDSLTDLLIAAGTRSLTDQDDKIQKGYQRAKELSWDQTAKQTAKVYQAVVGNTTPGDSVLVPEKAPDNVLI